MKGADATQTAAASGAGRAGMMNLAALQEKEGKVREREFKLAAAVEDARIRAAEAKLKRKAKAGTAGVILNIVGTGRRRTRIGTTGWMKESSARPKEFGMKRAIPKNDGGVQLHATTTTLLSGPW